MQFFDESVALMEKMCGVLSDNRRVARRSPAVAIAILGLLCLVGCDPTSPPFSPVLQKRAGGQKTAEECVASWAKMGMYLPDENQVAVFRDDFANKTRLLKDALADKNSSVRMRAALVIGKIGSQAKELGEELLDRLKTEQDQLVQIYIVDAIIGIGYNTAPTIEKLTQMYGDLSDENEEANTTGMYSEVDQKINVASAIYALSKSPERSEYYDFVTKWLDQPSTDVQGALLDGYWDRRWMAVISLEHMPQAIEAIAKLEKLRDEPNAKPWVKVHVPQVIAYLQRNAR